MLDLLRKNRDAAMGLLFIAISIGAFAASYTIRELVDIRIGPRFVPRLTAVVLALLSGLLVIQSIIVRRKITAQVGSDAVVKVADEKASTPSEQINQRAVLWTVILLVLYVSLLGSIGFVITTAVYLFLQFLVLTPKEKRSWWLSALIAVAVALSVNYIFVRWFRLMLPSGMLW